jgi:hypothetical protein
MKHISLKLSLLLFIGLRCFQLAQAQAELPNPTFPFWKTRGNSATTGIHFVGTTDDRALRFRTNNIERMIIDSVTGHVGIGGNPGMFGLHLRGNGIWNSAIEILNTGTGQSWNLGVNGTNFIITKGSGSTFTPFELYNDGRVNFPNTAGSIDRLYILDNGRVGLSTSNPLRRLHLAGSTETMRVDGLATGGSFITAPAALTDKILFADALGDLRALAAGSTGQTLTYTATGPAWATPVASGWTTTGNAGTVDGTNFIGTTDNVPFNFRVNNQRSGKIDHLSHNVTFGHLAGSIISTGTFNTFIGDSAGRAVSSHTRNIAVGASALYSLAGMTNGSNNVAIGVNAMRNVVYGNRNVALGNEALRYIDGGYGENVAIGDSAAHRSQYDDNVAIGSSALLNAGISSGNIAVGTRALYMLRDPAAYMYTSNIAVGHNALYATRPTNLTNGRYNNAIGNYTLHRNTTGYSNNSFGQNAMYSNSTGYENVGIGEFALYFNTSGFRNIALGHNAGMANTTGNANILIGYEADVSANNLSNAVAIGANAQVNTVNSMVLGSVAGVNGANRNIKVAIGNNAPNTSLDIKGDLALRERVLTLANGINSNVPVDSNTFFRVTGPVSLFSLTGLAGGVDGKIVTLFNGTSSTMYVDAMTLSLPANQILTGAGDLLVADSGTVTLQYNSTISKWVVTSYNNASYASASASDWSITGNSLTSPGTNFMGTTDNVDVMFKRNGFQAGILGTTNTAWGDRALIANSTGNSNTAIGAYAMTNNSTGQNNTAVGINALTKNLTGSLNVAAGRSALSENTSGRSNIAIGTDALRENTTRSNLVAIGDSAMYNTGTGIMTFSQGVENTAVGSKALFQNITGARNTAIGFNTLKDNTASDNTALGDFALASNTSGESNSVIGSGALLNNTTGSFNTVNGALAMQFSIAGSNNIALGAAALRLNNSGSNNVSVGSSTLFYNTDRSYLVAIGDSAMYNNGNGADVAVEAIENTAVGTKTLFANRLGSSNTAIGFNALLTNDGGSNNVALGRASLSSVSGSNNTAVGYNSGVNLDGGLGNLFLGASSGVTTSPISNSAAIGNNAMVSANSNFIIGDTLNRPKVGIGVTAVGKTKANTFMEIARTGSANVNILTRYAGSGLPAIVMQRSLGSLTAPTLVSSGQALGSLSFGGYDGVDWEDAAYIDVRVDSTSAVNSMPSRIEFYTRSVVGLVAQERMEINRNGHVGIGTSAQQTSLHVNGGLVLERVTVTASTDDFPVTVGNRSYFIISGTAMVAAVNRTIILSNGLSAGQMLYIECGTVGSIEFRPSTNLTLPGGLAITMTPLDVLHLIWDGIRWVTVSFSDNT